MSLSFLRHDANSITSFSHLGLLLGGLYFGTRGGWMFVLAVIAAVSLALWMANFRRSRAVADTPTSRVASAPQGYVELYGVARHMHGESLFAPLSARPCVWYRFKVEEKRGKDWRVVQQGVSDACFWVEDKSGRALIDPEHAEVMTSDVRIWNEGSRRLREWLLVPSLAAYVIGEFATVGGHNSALDSKAGVNALLAEWKSKQPQLKSRFDLNCDGSIDQKEWALARRAAQREILKQHQEIRAQPGVHVVRKPGDGRLFLISSHAPDMLARRFGWWTNAQLCVALFAGLAWAAVAITG